MKSYFISTLIAYAILIGCGTNSAIESQTTGKQLIFGNGGGFTGVGKSYIIQESGIIYSANLLSGDKQELLKVKNRTCKQLFNKASEIALLSSDFNHPGNRYFFIEYSDGNNKNRVTWGDSGHEVPSEFKEFYQLLEEIVKP